MATSTSNSGGTATAVTTVNSQIFTHFSDEDIIDSGQTTVTENVWSSEIGGTLTAFFTSSVQVSSSGDYYYDVYQTTYSATSAAVQFAIAYGNAQGSGSYEKFTNMGVSGYTPSKAVYFQYANTLLPTGTSRFTVNGNSINDFIAINFQRERVKEVLDPGNWELTVDNGAGVITTLVDSNTGISESSVSETYDIVSGSISSGIYSSTSPVYYGKAYPKYGMLIFDARVLKNSASIDIAETEHSSSESNNIGTMFDAIKAGASFTARNKQTIASQYYFVRVKNNKYNYSNNPTYWVTGSLRFADFVSDPVSYITTVGLYNDSTELLAVAKISQPIKKTKTTESLIRVCLNF